MSKRRRPQTKTAVKADIEWLNHRQGYPTPEERAAIVEMRRELMVHVMRLMLRRLNPDHPEYRALVDRYGPQEIDRAMDRLQTRMALPRIDYGVHEYREYRQGFALFGEGLTFHSKQEWESARESRDTQIIQTMQKNGEMSWENSLDQALLIGWVDWNDLVPLAVPARPSDFTCPAPGSYAPPAAELLEYGPDLQKQYDYQDPRWKKAIPALTRMALDPGLVNGWPGEKASWAPWHAAHLLGLLEAWDSAPALAELAGMENDWLSDHLSHIWADMGTGVLPTLWTLLEDANVSTKLRGLTAEALFTQAEEDEAMSLLVTRGFEKILARETKVDPRLNAYLISFLKDLEGAVEEIEDAIVDAFEAGRVDEKFIMFEDLFEGDEE